MAYIATLSDEDAAKFGDLYEQESMASARSINDRAAAINAETTAKLVQNAQVASNVSTWISIAVFFIILIAAIQMFK